MTGSSVAIGSRLPGFTAIEGQWASSRAGGELTEKTGGFKRKVGGLKMYQDQGILIDSWEAEDVPGS